MKEPQYYAPEDVFDFGQYKGLLIKEVLESNRNYIKWCIFNIDWFLMSDDLIKAYAGQLADTIIPKEHSRSGNAIKFIDYLPYINEDKIGKFNKTKNSE